MSASAKVIPRDWLDWPFFEPRHRALCAQLDRFVGSGVLDDVDHGDVDNACRRIVRALGAAGLLDSAVVAPDADAAAIDSRAICLSRETLAYADGLADFAFAMQGLGSGAIALGGSPELRAGVLPKVRSGEWLAAFALSEKEAGSDVAAMACAARLDGDAYVLDGEKTWISNGGIADVYTLFARSGEAPGARGISAFVVFPDDPGFSVAERIEVIAPHPLATLRLQNCRIPASRRLGPPGGGFKLAMQTLDIFRASVAAAALGFGRRGLDEAQGHAASRRMFGGALSDLQMTQAAFGEMATETDAAALLTYRAAWRRDVQKLPSTREAAMAKLAATETAQRVIDRSLQMFGEMATETDAAALLTYRAAWRRDVQKLSTTREAAMAKLTATETAQRVIDRSLQMFGGRGVRKGEIIESLYREIRALRIYEGASEVQKLIVAREFMKSRAPTWVKA